MMNDVVPICTATVAAFPDESNAVIVQTNPSDADVAATAVTVKVLADPAGTTVAQFRLELFAVKPPEYPFSEMVTFAV